MLALGALNLNLPEPLPIFSATGRRTYLTRKVHMRDILLWAAVGLLFVAGALAILIV